MDKWNLIINVGLCENCQNCVISMRDEHVGNEFKGYAAAAAPVSDTPLHILRRVQGSAPMMTTTYLPVMCNHCDDAPCKKVGGDAVRKRDDGIVIIDPEKARGRKDILDACPYGAIVWNEEKQVPQTWIFDAHLIDQGWSMPRCQQVCPTDVFEAVKVDDGVMAERARRDNLNPLRPDLGTKPRVWYRNLDLWQTCFIGGSVSAKVNGLVDVVVEAKVSLVKDGQILANTLTDAFGDFRFDRLPANSGIYRIEVRHPLGCASQECALGESVYLGELALCAVDSTADVVSS